MRSIDNVIQKRNMHFGVVHYAVQHSSPTLKRKLRKDLATSKLKQKCFAS